MVPDSLNESNMNYANETQTVFVRMSERRAALVRNFHIISWRLRAGRMNDLSKHYTCISHDRNLSSSIRENQKIQWTEVPVGNMLERRRMFRQNRVRLKISRKLRFPTRKCTEPGGRQIHWPIWKLLIWCKHKCSLWSCFLYNIKSPFVLDERIFIVYIVQP